MFSPLSLSVLIIYSVFSVVGKFVPRSDSEIFSKGFYGYPVSISYYFLVLIFGAINLLVSVLGFIGAIISDPNVMIISLFTGIFTRQSSWFIDGAVKIQFILSLFTMLETPIMFKVGKEITLFHIVQKVGLILVTEILINNPSSFMLFFLLFNSSIYCIVAINNLLEFIIGRMCKDSTLTNVQIRVNFAITCIMAMLFGGKMWIPFLYYCLLLGIRTFDIVLYEKVADTRTMNIDV